MKTFPSVQPAVRITPSELAPFMVTSEELPGWFIIPKLGQTCKWATYDHPERKMTGYTDMSVTGKACVHGIEGVEILSRESPFEGSEDCTDRIFIVQLTDTHIRFLAEPHSIDDIRYYSTFLDPDEFLPNWGMGEDNCGQPIIKKQKGLIQQGPDGFTAPDAPSVNDVIGRYTVEMAGKRYDTILVMYIERDAHSAVMTETYFDKNGKTVLWRRFNRDDWALTRYKKRWSEQLPENESISINGMLFVHWYDCISDYIL